MTHLAIKNITIDCGDPERLAEFWSALLGRPIGARRGPYVWLRSENGPAIVFQRVAEPKPGKNRVHLDLAAPDPGAEQQRIEALGGRRVPGYDPGGFLVMADPEGNEFCVLPTEPFDVDDEGKTNYLNSRP